MSLENHINRKTYRDIAISKGATEQQADDLYTSFVVDRLKQRSNLNPQVASAIDKVPSFGSEEDGQYSFKISQALANIGNDSEGAIGNLRNATLQGSGFDPLSDSSYLESISAVDQDLDISDIKSSFEIQEEESGPGVWDSMKRGILNDSGFLAATAGLGAKAIGDFTDSRVINAAGDTLLNWADDRFEDAESIKQAEGMFGGVSDLVLQQIPSAVLTLGAGWAAKTGAKAVLGTGVKKATKEILEKELKKSVDLSDAQVKDLLTDELIGKVSNIATRGVYFNAGKEQIEKNLFNVLKPAAREVAEATATRNTISGVVAPIVGTTVASYGINTGAMYQELESERQEGDREVTFGDVALIGAGAAAVEAIPSLYFLEKFGILSRPGLIKNVFKEATKDPKKAGVLRKVASVGKGAGLEGATESIQGMFAEEAKRQFINSLDRMDDEQKLEVLPYLLRPEALARYGEEFLAGAVVGGIFDVTGRLVKGKEPEAVAEDKPKTVEAEKEFLEKNIDPINAWTSASRVKPDTQPKPDPVQGPEPLTDDNLDLAIQKEEEQKDLKRQALISVLSGKADKDKQVGVEAKEEATVNAALDQLNTRELEAIAQREIKEIANQGEIDTGRLRDLLGAMETENQSKSVAAQEERDANTEGIKSAAKAEELRAGLAREEAGITEPVQQEVDRREEVEQEVEQAATQEPVVEEQAQPVVEPTQDQVAEELEVPSEPQAIQEEIDQRDEVLEETAPESTLVDQVIEPLPSKEDVAPTELTSSEQSVLDASQRLSDATIRNRGRRDAEFKQVVDQHRQETGDDRPTSFIIRDIKTKQEQIAQANAAPVGDANKVISLIEEGASTRRIDNALANYTQSKGEADPQRGYQMILDDPDVELNPDTRDALTRFARAARRTSGVTATSAAQIEAAQNRLKDAPALAENVVPDPQASIDERTDPNDARMTEQEIYNYLDTQPVDVLRELRVEVTDTQAFQDQFGDQGAVTWNGALKDGVIYLNRDNITESNIERVLFHEGLGHAVAEKAMGTETFNRVMGEIIRDLREFNKSNLDYKLPNGRSLRELVNTYTQAYGNDPNIEKKLAGEIWANYIEVHADPSGLQNRSLLSRIIESVKQFFTGKKFKVADTEAARLVRKARANTVDLKRGGDLSTSDLTPSEMYFSAEAESPRATKDLLRSLFASKAGNYIPDLSSPDIPAMTKFLRMPQWIANQKNKDGSFKYPTLKKVYDILQSSRRDRSVLAHRLIKDYSDHTNLNPEDTKAVDAVLVQGDRRNEEYATAQEAGLTPEQFKGYQSVRKSLDHQKDLMIEDLESNLADIEAKRSAAISDGQDPQGFEKLAEDTKKEINNLRSIKGYIPRVRRGKWLLQYTDNDGVNYLEEILDNDGKLASNARAREFGTRRIAELKAKGIKEIKWHNNKNEAEKPFDVSNANVDAFIMSYLNDPKFKDISDSLRETMKNLMYAQSFRKHRIRRVQDADEPGTLDTGEETAVYQGYQTTDLSSVFADNAQGFATAHSRNKAARAIKKVMEETDMRGRESEIRFTNDMMNNANKSQDGLDKLDNFLSAAAFHTWIGGRVTSAVWNGMHTHMFGASQLRTGLLKDNKEYQGLGGLVKLSREMAGNHTQAVKYQIARAKAKGPVSPEQMGIDPNNAEAVAELDVLNKAYEIVNSQTLASQGYSDMLSKDAPMYQQAMNKYGKLAGFMMQHTEISNRLSSVLAHYKRQTPKAGETKSLNDAVAFSEDLNANYEKFNLPKWLQGNGTGAKIIRPLAFTFQTHVQNTYEMMYEMAKNDRQALMYAFGMMGLMGGLPAYAAWEGLMKLFSGKDLDTEIKDHLGENWARMAKSGALFTAMGEGGVDAGRSLQIGAPPIFNLIGALAGTNQEVAALAPFNNMIKAYQGEQPVYKYMPIKWMQSIWQAYDGANDSVKVGRNQVYGADGRPMRLNGAEAALQALGFVPMRSSDASREIYTESQLNRYWNGYKSKVLDALQFAKTPIERAEARKAMREFNEDLRAIKREGYRFLRTKPASPSDITEERRIKRLRGENE